MLVSQQRRHTQAHLEDSLQALGQLNHEAGQLRVPEQLAQLAVRARA